MKKAIILLSFFGFIVVALTTISSCKKEKTNNTPGDEFPTGNITGNVILPTGSTADVNTLTVLSPFTETTVSTGSYTTETYTEEYTTQLVSNANDDVLLMGYTYPGLTDHTIDARSTALALVMNMPASLFLTEQGKKQMISNVLASPKLNDLVVAIENTVKTNKALFDTVNTDVIVALDALFANASFKTEQTQAVPVNMSHAGRNFIFSNKPLAHGSVVGIYKDGQRVQKILVEGLQFFPTTINEAVNGYGGISGNPVDYNYELQGDGDFEIKIRTGRPGASDGSLECTEARIDNLVQFASAIRTTLLPSVTPKNPTCKQALRILLRNLISGQQSFSNSQPTSVAGLSVLLLSLTTFVFSNEQMMITACPPPVKAVGFMSKISKLFGTVATKLQVVGNVANAANMTMFAAQWYFTTPAYDTCFRAQGNAVTNCSNGTVTDIDGNVYNTVQIGSQTWMKENLKTAHYRDGSAITEIEDSLAWANIFNTNSQTPAWCYYSGNAANNSTYGKLYNWYAVADSRNVCPTGWHVPTDAEFTQLTNYLGGEAVAGGKMKAITLWNAPNTGADNSSGFTALPGGYRSYDAYFYSVGNDAVFWSSTSNGSPYAWFRSLYYDKSNTNRGTEGDKEYGFSVRCVKD